MGIYTWSLVPKRPKLYSPTMKSALLVIIMVAFTFSLNFAEKFKYAEKYSYLPKRCDLAPEFCPHGVAPEGMIHRLSEEGKRGRQSCCRSSDPKNNMMLYQVNSFSNRYSIVPYKEGYAVKPLPTWLTIV